MTDAELKRKWDNTAIRQYQEQQVNSARQEGRQEGRQEVIEGLITKLGLPDEQIADVAKVSIDFVKKVRASLDKK